MSTDRPDYPMSLARDRFGLWLHVTGLSLREVVHVLPEHFATDALLVYEPEQLHYATSALIDQKQDEGATREQVLDEMACLDAQAFWNRIQPLFENPSCAVWPADCLDEMILVQGPRGGAFGACPIPPDFVKGLPTDFLYEHPSNVAAKVCFLSVDDTASSVYATDEEDIVRLLQFLLHKALDAPPGDTEGLEDVARGLLPWLEQGGVDLRANPPGDSQDHASATVALGMWNVRSQWPLLWRRVGVCEVSWNGRKWTLSEVRHVPGGRFISPVRLVGEAFQSAVRLATYGLIFGLPIAVAVITWVASGWELGIIALLVALVLWPRFVLGSNWRDLRRRRAAEDERKSKYGL